MEKEPVVEKSKELDNLSVDVQIVRESLGGLLGKLENEDILDPKFLKETIKKIEADLWQIQQTMVEIAHK